MVEPIRFYTDEHVGRSIISGLRRRGVDVLTVPEADMLGATDFEHMKGVHAAPFSLVGVGRARDGHLAVALSGWQQRLQRLDRALIAAAPSVGRYCWETVIVLQR